MKLDRLVIVQPNKEKDRYDIYGMTFGDNENKIISLSGYTEKGTGIELHLWRREYRIPTLACEEIYYLRDRLTIKEKLKIISKLFNLPEEEVQLREDCPVICHKEERKTRYTFDR